jgi:hypothetical protein
LDHLHPAQVDAAGIHISDRGISSIDGRRAIAFVPRQDILRIVLRHGHVAPRPLAQLLVGAVLAFIGLLATGYFAAWLLHRGTLLGIVIWLIPLAPAGIFQMLTAFRSGHYLDVTTRDGNHKLPLDTAAAQADIERLIADAMSGFGDKIERSIETCALAHPSRSRL